MEIKEKVRLITSNNLFDGISQDVLLTEIRKNIYKDKKLLQNIRIFEKYFFNNTTFLHIFLYDANERPIGYLYYSLDSDFYLASFIDDSICIKDNNYIKDCMNTLILLECMK